MRTRVLIKLIDYFFHNKSSFIKCLGIALVVAIILFIIINILLIFSI